MTKEELDKIIEILGNMDSFDKALEICTICKDEHLMSMMQKAIQSGEEQLLLETVEQLKVIINSRIPPELLEYYYIQAINRDATHLLDDKQRKKAKELYNEKIECLDEDERIKAAREIDNQEVKLGVLKTLSDAKKLEVLDELDESTRNLVAMEITDDYVLLETVDKVDDLLKSLIAEKIKSPKVKLQALDKLGIGRLDVVQTIDDQEVQQEALSKLTAQEKRYFAIHTDNIGIKLNVLGQIEEEGKVEVVKSISDSEQRFQMLDYLQGSSKLEVAVSLGNPMLMLQAREMFTDEEKAIITDATVRIVKLQKPEDSILRRLYDKNPDVLKKIDYRLLDKRYIDTLGEEKISIIAIRKGVQAQILSLDDKRYEVFYKCIDNYLQSAESEDWRPMAQKLLECLKTGEYDELIDSIEDTEQIDFAKLSIIMQSSNKYEIKTVEDLERYEEIVRKKCDEIISEDGNIQEKKNAVLQKLFGQDLEYAKKMIKQFGEDIENIRDGDEKDIVLSLKAIMDLEDESVLREIYKECEEIGLVNGMAIERKVKTAYAEKFNEGLYQPKERDLIPQKDLDEELRGQGLRVYNAGTDFRMILTSVSSFDYKSKISDHQKFWNRPINSVQHCCTSYIRNDMLGTSGIRYFCYGFTRDEARWISGFQQF